MQLWAQADIVNLLNHALSADYALEDPWEAFKLGKAAPGLDAEPAADSVLHMEGQNGQATATLLQGIELPSDTDDSSFRFST